MFEYGSEWVRSDFHLHTRKDKEFKYIGEENSFVKKYVEELEKKEIKVGVITNHNKFDCGEYKALRKEAKRKDIFLLPGVELSVKDGKNGIHTLIVFNPEEWLEQDENYIEKFLISSFQGIKNFENENTCCNFDLNTLLSELEKLNKEYFLIFAHAEQKNGIINELGGDRLKKLANKKLFKKRVLALQKISNENNINKVKQCFGREIAKVEGSDPKNLEDVGRGKKCYLKIGEYSYNVIKYALLDFENRVSKDKVTKKHGYIESVYLKGGKLDEVKINFSNELNTIIGIRGSGKSSIIELLRYTLGLEANVDKEYKNKLIKHTIESGGKIELDVVDKNGKKYKIIKFINDSESIFNDLGEEIFIPIDALINNPLYFGQKDLSRMDSGYAFDLLKKITGNSKKNIEDIIYNENEKIIEYLEKYFKIKQSENEILEKKLEKNKYEHDYKDYIEKGVLKKLELNLKYENDSKTIEKIINNLNEIHDIINEAKNRIERIDILDNEFESENEEIKNKISKALKQYMKFISQIFEENKNYNLTKIKINENKEKFLSKKKELEEQFAEIKRELSKEDIDSDLVIKTKENLNSIREEIKRIEKEIKSKEKIKQEIKKAIHKRTDVLNENFHKYEKEIKKINEGQENLKINIIFEGDKNKFLKDLQEKFKGTNINKYKYEEISKKFTDFVSIISDAILDDGAKLKNILSDNEFINVKNKIEENYKDLIKTHCPDLVQIFYHDKLLEKHSIGQRASALILLILTQKDNDLVIIDQPEDDLDNQVIYQEVISTIKKRKKDIQFVLVTHNPNIPVLGDAECIITTEYNEKINVDVGNIDCKNTQDKIVNIMEGGKDAFKKRKLIYDNWNKE